VNSGLGDIWDPNAREDRKSRRLTGIDHIEMNVDDLDAMVAFPKQAGFLETRRTEHIGGLVELRCPGGPDAPIFEINQSDEEPKCFRHIVMYATDIDGADKDHIEAGFEVIRLLYAEPKSSGRRVFNLKDPKDKKLLVLSRVPDRPSRLAMPRWAWS
jgi:hypothetical protein